MTENRENTISESSVGDYRNDPDLNAAIGIPQTMNVDFNSVINRLVEEISILRSDVRKLKEQKKNLLTQEEKRELANKNMLQIIRNPDWRSASSIDEIYLFLKAIGSGEPYANIVVRYKLSHLQDINNEKTIHAPILHENGQHNSNSNHPISVNGLEVFFETKIVEICPLKKDRWGRMQYSRTLMQKMILNFPEKKNLRIFAQESKFDTVSKIYTLAVNKTEKEEEIMGVKRFQYTFGTSSTIDNENFARKITWTVINDDN